MNKVALYFRLSVEEQSGREESESIISQRNYVTSFFKAQSDLKDFPYEEYIDDGFSGSNTKRPGFERMMNDVKANLVKTIIVKDLSRFMRDYIAMGDYLENIFPFMGVRFIAINDNYDSSKEKGNGTELDIQFKNLLYDFYAKDASQKVRSVQNALKAKGKFMAWQPPFGYIKDPNDKYKIIVDDEVAHIVREAFELSLKGMPTRKIAQLFNEKNYITPYRRKKQTSRMDYSYKTTTTENHKEPIWMHGTVIKILGNENYTGTYCYNMVQKSIASGGKSIPVPRKDWGRVFNNHEAIISRKMFDQVRDQNQAKAFKNVDYSQLKEIRYPLEGFIVCEECGHILARESTTRHQKNGIKKFNYMSCRTCKAKKLEIKRMKLELIEETVWNLLKEKVQSEESIEEEPQWKSTKLDRITLLESAKEEAFHQYKTGKLSREDFIAKKCSIDVDIEMIENEVEEQDYEKLKVTDSLTREIVERYIDKVIVSHGGGIEVVLKV